MFQAAETYVFVVRDEKAVRLPVQTGERKAGRVAILTGLEEGDEVVIRGLGRLRDGSAVNILGAGDATAKSADGDS